jgi:hypothetical protein
LDDENGVWTREVVILSMVIREGLIEMVTFQKHLKEMRE